MKHCHPEKVWNKWREGLYVEQDDRQVWQITVGLGVPDPAETESEGIHQIALALEESVHRIRGVNRIPCYTEFGPVMDVMMFAQRALDEGYDPATAPVECSLAVYATDKELDELIHAVVEALEVDKQGYSSTVGGEVRLGLNLLSLDNPDNSFYRHLVDQFQYQSEGI